MLYENVIITTIFLKKKREANDLIHVKFKGLSLPKKKSGKIKRFFCLSFWEQKR